jgi:hypothetical protein
MLGQDDRRRHSGETASKDRRDAAAGEARRGRSGESHATADGPSAPSLPSQSRPQSIRILASRCSTSSALCIACSGVDRSISPRVPRKRIFMVSDP